MKLRTIRDNVFWLGAIDWDRRLFDSLIPLPDGTSYNSYLIVGSEKTLLVDSVDPEKEATLLTQLENIQHIDYIVSNHSEQDHSGSIPILLEKYPNSVVLTSDKGKDMLMEHLLIPSERIRIVTDEEEISLGDKTMRFLYTPWVHWPETMVTYLIEEKIMFSCDLFGSHVATTDLYVRNEELVFEAAKRYFAEIMMPFSNIIRRNIEKIKKLEIELIAPSHGPIYDKPSQIIKAYEEWTSDSRSNLVVIPFVSMHGSTKIMVEYLVSALSTRGVNAQQFDLTVVDIGKLAIGLIDAATVILGTPTVHAGPHPLAVYAAYLLNALKPKIKHISVIGSYGWYTKTIDQVVSMLPKLKDVDILDPVYPKGYPKDEDFRALDVMADNIAMKHKELDLL